MFYDCVRHSTMDQRRKSWKEIAKLIHDSEHTQKFGENRSAFALDCVVSCIAYIMFQVKCSFFVVYHLCIVSCVILQVFRPVLLLVMKFTIGRSNGYIFSYLHELFSEISAIPWQKRIFVDKVCVPYLLSKNVVFILPFNQSNAIPLKKIFFCIMDEQAVK